MIDAFGNELKVGDHFAYASRYGSHVSLRIMEVTLATPWNVEARVIRDSYGPVADPTIRTYATPHLIAKQNVEQ